ncbi:hypothetical protein T05_12472 [Trichinella murrelli]|uniref:Uncharacterized protein n=1 Tax=Trichinella murrelli TaxID=144512 RepID=A0A0V0SVW3_9BILA|nr:hypothetical protein T05_12472 [Trichinella murrelli]
MYCRRVTHSIYELYVTTMHRLYTGTQCVVTLRTFLTRVVPLRTFQTRDVLLRTIQTKVGEGGGTSNSRSCVCVCMERWLCDSTVLYSNRCTADE